MHIAEWRSTLGVLVALLPACAYSQTLAPPYDTNYSLSSVGSIPGVPTPYGGITFLAGSPNTLLVGGSANNPGGGIYQIDVTRDSNNHITVFSGTASLYATAPNIDGGLAYGPGGVLFATTYSDNNVLQYLPGSSAPDKTIDLTPLGVGSSTGTLQFVPAGFPGAGGLRIVSYSTGGYYTADLSPDGSGTFDILNVVQQTTTSGGPEGLIFVPQGSALFPTPSVLISEWAAGFVAAYELDANGHPDPSTRQDFITGLSGAEGAVIDPVSGDFLFSTFGGGDQLIVVTGFAAVPEPQTIIFACTAGIIGAGIYSRKFGGWLRRRRLHQ